MCEYPVILCVSPFYSGSDPLVFLHLRGERENTITLFDELAGASPADIALVQVTMEEVA